MEWRDRMPWSSFSECWALRETRLRIINKVTEMLTDVINSLPCCQMQWTLSSHLFQPQHQPTLLGRHDCQLFPHLISPLGWFFLLYLNSQWWGSLRHGSCPSALLPLLFSLGLPGGSMIKNLPAKQETWVRSLGREDSLEKGMATHSSILAWRIFWTEEPGGLRSMRSQRVGHDWKTNAVFLDDLTNPYNSIVISMSTMTAFTPL